MGLSTGRDLHVNVPLSNIAIKYRPENFVADQLAPIVRVNKQADSYLIWSIAEAYAIHDTRRAPGTEANVITRSVSSATFYCENYALKDRIPYEDLKNADAAMILTERTARAEGIKDALMLDYENRVATQLTNTSNVGSSSAVSSAWTDFANSDPITDIKTAINNIEDLTGMRPNSIAFSGTAWRNFRENATVITRVYGNQTGAKGRMIGIENAKGIFEMERVVVAGAYKNSNQEGQSASLSRMWGDHVLVYYAPMRPRKDKASFMYSFRWNEVPGMNMVAEIFQLKRAKAEEVQLGYYQDEKITAAILGYLVTNVTSSS